MHSLVTVIFKDRDPITVELSTKQAMPRDEAREWLDQQFVALECEPLRATGKLLMADRVVVVAQAAGPAKFADSEWAYTFARATSAVLGKPVITVGGDSLTITY
jgi:hypothetical protein